jgi:L-alanine-DL-glutamate epimerase-like enolase superfamily enzyme
MCIDSVEIFALRIPFRVSVSHSAHKDRSACDSVVLRISSGGQHGYGEAVFRDYVSGFASGTHSLASRATEIAGRMVGPLFGCEVAWQDVAADGIATEPQDLPMLCALETALLDLACRTKGNDAYSMLGLEPVRSHIVFSGAIPLVPSGGAAYTITQFAQFGNSSFKIKLGPDPDENRAILAACRGAVGDRCDLRVDANGAWRVVDADAHMDACEANGVTAVEQPFPVAAPGADDALHHGIDRGFFFIADEGFLTEHDLEAISSAGTYQLLNFRLSKNGGITRVLRLARTASERGIGHQLGCMVGETGILSALGRMTASLLPAPRWVEGGYDRILYSKHLTTSDFGFGPDGTAPVIRGAGIGYSIREEQLVRFTVQRVRIA